MLIAKAKRKENIIEYILYMYQIEDIIRSLSMDMDLINQNVVSRFDQSEAVIGEIRSWYAAIVKEMKENDLQRSGHIPSLKTLVRELQELHKNLLTTYQDEEYQKYYNAAREELITLVKRSGGMKLENEIDVALNGMYGLLILRLKKKEISSETQTAMEKIGKMLAKLAIQFKRYEKGELSISAISKN